MSQQLLPEEFADLEQWVGEWALSAEQERYAKRLRSTMAELKAFYDAVLPRAPAAKDYLDTYRLEEIPEDGQRLLWLLFSLIMVSYPVELWGQPRTPDTGSAEFTRTGEPKSFPV